MGLDMNFYKKIYLDPMKKGRKHPTVRVGKYKKAWCFKGDSDISQAKAYKDVKYIVCDAGYLRKAYAIHDFIVDHCFEGDDPNCMDIVMPKETIKELREICSCLLRRRKQKNFKELARKMLPSNFGDSNYDEWYLEDLEDFLKFSDEWELDNDDVVYVYHPWY